MDDSISRQVVAKFLDDWLFCLDENCHKQSVSDLKMIIKDFKNLPSAQPETNCSEIPNNWIPCSERLPDTNREVLLQFETNMGVGFWENGEWGVNTGDNIYSEIGKGEARPIAWCELPEQYQKGGEQAAGDCNTCAGRSECEYCPRPGQ